MKKNKLICYPQQLGRSWKDFVPEPFGTLSAMCNRHLSNSVCYLHQNHPELHCLLNRNLPEPDQLSAPKQSGSLLSAITPSNSPQTLLTICTGTLGTHQPSGTLQNLVCTTPFETSSPICTGTLWNFISHLHWIPPELHQPSAPEPSGSSSAICTRTLPNFISFLRHNPPELHQPSAPEPSGISSAICTGTLRNLVCYLHRNPPEPCLLSAPDGTLWNFINFLHRNPPEPPAPEHSGTSSAFSTRTLRNLIICTGTLRNLISHLHQNPPEPSGTLRNLLRNLQLQLHRIAPQLFWAKDPIASFAVGEKKKSLAKTLRF